LLAALAMFAAIGFWDDYRKLRGAKGLSMGRKLALQSAAALALLLWLAFMTPLGENAELLIPYFKGIALPLGAVGFVILGYFVVVGASNAVNLTDGLDGLAILPAVMVCGGLGIFAYASGHSVFAAYLDIPHIAGAQELAIFCAAFIGAGLSFLWFNAHPAEVFMGDVGSLALGAALGVVALIIRQEIVFFIMSGVFVAEALSVMTQIIAFKLTGRRILLMAPLHHHFEKKEKWKEGQIVVRFWIVTIILVLIGLAALKIR
jgi:phospho-N-acetylmuramoyl-pentapeptide-transferase